MRIQEVAAAHLYPRKEALIPLATVVVRLLIYLVIGISGLIFFKSIGAPMIAAAEISFNSRSHRDVDRSQSPNEGTDKD